MNSKPFSIVLSALVLSIIVYAASFAADSTFRPYQAGSGAPTGSPAGVVSVPTPSAVEAAPEKLLQRIKVLEQRLADADRKMADLEKRFASHKHEYVSFIPNGYGTLGGLIDNIRISKDVVIPYHQGGPITDFTHMSSAPK